MGYLSDHPLNHRRRAIDLAQISSFTIAARIGYRQRVLLLRRVNPDKRFGILLHGPPSAHEARLGPPEQPSYSYCTSGRAADHGPGHNVWTDTGRSALVAGTTPHVKGFRTPARH